MEGVVLVVLIVLGAIGLGFVAFIMAMGQRTRLADLTARFDASIRAINALSEEVKALRGGFVAVPPIPTAPIVAEPMARPEPAVIVNEPVAPMEPAVAAAAPEPSIVESLTPAPATETLEQKLANRWILWAGAVALALGGAFLVKFAIDQGWFGPTARTLMGFLSGCALTAGGEWLRRRPPQLALAALPPNYVPPAFTAAGVSIAYTSAYAAFELYSLLPPIAAFIVLGVLSMSAVFLSILQGPLVAVLGIVGGFVTPLLVTSEDPSTWGLYIYLTFIVGSALAVVRFTRAWWLGFIALAGTIAWLVLSFATYGRPQDAEAIGAFLLAVAALGLFVPAPDLLDRDAPAWDDVLEGRLPASAVVAWLTMVLVSVSVFVLLRMDSYGSTSLVVLALFAILCFYMGRRAPSFDTLPVLAGVVTLAAIAAWHLPAIIPGAIPDPAHPPQPEVFVNGYNTGPILAPSLASFLSITAGFVALFGVGGFTILWHARRPAVWAGLAATMPVLLLAIAYWRIEAFDIAFSWAAVSIVLAAANVFAASQLRNHSNSLSFTIGVGAFAAAAVAAITLGAAMTLREAWLTVAFSLQLPALAWIGDRLGLRVLRPVAMAVASVVLVRLILNPELLRYQLASMPVLNWILYGYGIPAAAFFAAASWFRRTADDTLVGVLEAGALLFATILITLEIHQTMTGSLRAASEGLLEPSLRSIAWLALAIGIARDVQRRARPVFVWGRNILAGGAALHIVTMQVLYANPLWSDDPVGTMPIFNNLLLAYGIPAALILIFTRSAIRDPVLAQIARILSLVLFFINVTLEVRHHFQGPVLSNGGVSDAEWYAYSAAWLGLSGVLLALGIRGRSAALRYGSLGVLVLTVGKVFLFDMEALTGLYRAASFAGLGLCLIAVGYLYQRFVFNAPPPEPADL
jgi:uncharacterized membrane protein